MSWCRWGSRCTNTIPTYEVDEACNPCPGSSLYIYEGDKLTCCSCSIVAPDDVLDGDFTCDTDAEMYAHILEHDARGDHVRRSMLEHAHGRDPLPTKVWRDFAATFKPD